MMLTSVMAINKVFGVNVSGEWIERFERASKVAGHKTVAAWLRSLGEREIEPPKQEVPYYAPSPQDYEVSEIQQPYPVGATGSLFPSTNPGFGKDVGAFLASKADPKTEEELRDQMRIKCLREFPDWTRTAMQKQNKGKYLDAEGMIMWAVLYRDMKNRERAGDSGGA